MCTMKAKNFFLNPGSVPQKQYEALRAYYVENRSAKEVAEDFGYKHRGFTSIVLTLTKSWRRATGKTYFSQISKRGENLQRTSTVQEIPLSGSGKSICR